MAIENSVSNDFFYLQSAIIQHFRLPSTWCVYVPVTTFQSCWDVFLSSYVEQVQADLPVRLQAPDYTLTQKILRWIDLMLAVTYNAPGVLTARCIERRISRKQNSPGRLSFQFSER